MLLRAYYFWPANDDPAGEYRSEQFLGLTLTGARTGDIRVLAAITVTAVLNNERALAPGAPRAPGQGPTGASSPHRTVCHFGSRGRPVATAECCCPDKGSAST